MNSRKYSVTSEKNFLLLLGVLFIIITFYLVKEIYMLIIYSMILSYFLYPLYKYYLKKIQNKRISSILTIFSATILVFFPLILLTYFLVLSLIKLVIKYKIYIENPQALDVVINNFMEKFANSTLLSNTNLNTYINSVASWIIDFSKSFFNSIPTIIIDLVIILFITYYILVHNKKMLKAVNNYLPLSLKRQDEILNSLQKNLKVLFKGYFLTGIAQTLIAFIGYLVFGVENLLIVTTLTLFASLIPYLGTPLIWVPIGLYMIISGNEFGGIGLLIYGSLIISMIDNFLRPILMSAKDTISPPLVFIGFIGGMYSFGIGGIIIGPIIISITSILLRYIKEHFELKD